MTEAFIDQVLKEVCLQHSYGGSRTPGPAGYLEYRGEDTPVKARLLALLPEGTAAWNVERYVHAAVLVLLDQQRIHRNNKDGYEYLVPGAARGLELERLSPDQRDGTAELQWEDRSCRSIYEAWKEAQPCT